MKVPKSPDFPERRLKSGLIDRVSLKRLPRPKKYISPCATQTAQFNTPRGDVCPGDIRNLPRPALGASTGWHRHVVRADPIVPASELPRPSEPLSACWKVCEFFFFGSPKELAKMRRLVARHGVTRA